MNITPSRINKQKSPLQSTSKVNIRTSSTFPSNLNSTSIIKTQPHSKMTNPEQNSQNQQPMISNFNDPILKLLSLNQGSALRDCKAILDTMKEQPLEDREKNTLFYQEDNIKSLVQDLKIKDIKIEKILKLMPKNLNKPLAKNRMVNIQKKTNNETFQNYNKLMKYSLRERQKGLFLTETAKRNKTYMNFVKKNCNRCLTDHNQKTSQPSQSSFLQSKLSELSMPSSSQTNAILLKFIQQKKREITLQSSSKLLDQETKLKQVMKNRQMCQKIMEEALMFQRYYDVMKKQKQTRNSRQVEKKKSEIKFKTESSQQNKKSITHKRLWSRSTRNKNSTSSIRPQSLNPSTSTNLNPNPAHLRLLSNKPKNPHSIQKLSEADYNRHKFIQRHKTEQHYNQLNRINEQIVQKKNWKNNLLIHNLMNFMRQNCIDDESSEQQHTEKLKNEDLTINSNNFNHLQINRSCSKSNSMSPLFLIKTLKKLFLLYSNKQTDDLQIQPFSIITQNDLNKFLKNFQINKDNLIKKNDKFKQIFEKNQLDEFEFVQMIHLIAAEMNKIDLEDKKFSKKQKNEQFHQNQQQFSQHLSLRQHSQLHHSHNQELYPNSPPQQNSPIYTNIHSFVYDYILHIRFSSYLFLEQHLLLKNKVSYHYINKLKKIYRFEQKLIKCVQTFIENGEGITLLNIEQKFNNDMEFMVEILWFMKIYPKYINKKYIRFYFYYLKQECGQGNSRKEQSSILNSYQKLTNKKTSSIKGINVLQNILWLIISRMTTQASNSKNDISHTSHHNPFDVSYLINSSHNQNKKPLDKNNQKQAIPSIFESKFKIVTKLLSSVINIHQKEINQ